MKEGIIYIEKTFWNKIISVRERYTLLDKLIHSQSAIYTNFHKEEVSCDTILGYVYDDTGGRLYWDKDINDYIDSDDIVSLTSIYLTDKDSSSCDKKSTQRGIVLFNNSQYSNDRKVFNSSLEMGIDKENRFPDGWKNNLFAPILSNNRCNSIIINDKYLCNKGYMNPDLKVLLDLILPQKTEIPFHLSIFSEVNSNGDGIYEEIKSALASIRTPEFCKNILLTLCYTTLHDRFIISNTFFITVGAGFALFNGGKKAQNSTSLKMHYPTAVGKKYEYYLWIKKTREINENTKNFWGERINRLFELVD